MEIRIDKPFSDERLSAEVRFLYRDTVQTARSFATAAVVVGAGGMAMLLAHSGMSGLVVLSASLAAYGGYQHYAVSRSLRQASIDYPAPLRQDGMVVLTDERIIQIYPSVRSEVAWSVIARVIETDLGWMLFYGRRHFVSLPRNGFSKATETEFRAFLDARDQAAV